MNEEQVLNFIQTADEETLQTLSNAIKSRARKPRAMISHIIKDDVYALAQKLPKTTTEYKSYRYANTCSYYIRVLRELTDLVLHNYTLRNTGRGYPMWHSHESVAESSVQAYKAVFHSLSYTLLSLMDEYDTTY